MSFFCDEGVHACGCFYTTFTNFRPKSYQKTTQPTSLFAENDTARNTGCETVFLKSYMRKQ